MKIKYLFVKVVRTEHAKRTLGIVELVALLESEREGLVGGDLLLLGRARRLECTKRKHAKP